MCPAGRWRFTWLGPSVFLPQTMQSGSRGVFDLEVRCAGGQQWGARCPKILIKRQRCLTRLIRVRREKNAWEAGGGGAKAKKKKCALYGGEAKSDGRAAMGKA